MKKFELVITRPNGKEEVIKRNLTEEQAIEYFENIDNTYYREQKQVKKYRVNGSEHFNLHSMRDKLYVMRDSAVEEGDWATADMAQDRIEEVESLLHKAPCVGSLVDWTTLKRIREIQSERQFIRYQTCLAAGDSEEDAALAFEL